MNKVYSSEYDYKEDEGETGGIFLKILVTGATGHLGSTLLNQLTNTDYKVKVTSRRKPDSIYKFEWVYGDLLSGEGLDEALKDVEVIIYAATSPQKNTKMIDVAGFGKFLSKAQHIKHLIYPSIVGIEDVPLKYYRYKLEAEELLENSSIPFTIVRATQFHSFVESLLLSKPLFNRYFVPGNIKFQSVDTSEFANHLVGFLHKGPQGRTDDFGGPTIITLKEMAELKIKINNETNKVVSFPLTGKIYKSLLDGKNTNININLGKITFEEYLRMKKE